MLKIIDSRGHSFVIHFGRVEIEWSARRHGVEDDDIWHAIENAVGYVELDSGDDQQPQRFLVLGPDGAGNLLEIVVMTTDAGDDLVIHAMPMRKSYERFLR